MPTLVLSNLKIWVILVTFFLQDTVHVYFPASLLPGLLGGYFYLDIIYRNVLLIPLILCITENSKVAECYSLSFPLNLAFLSVTANFEERSKRGHRECTFRQHISKNRYIKVASQFFFLQKTMSFILWVTAEKPYCKIRAGVSH